MCALNRLQRIFYWLLGGLLFHLIKMSFRSLNKRFLLVRKTTQQIILFKIECQHLGFLVTVFQTLKQNIAQRFQHLLITFKLKILSTLFDNQNLICSSDFFKFNLFKITNNSNSSICLESLHFKYHIIFTIFNINSSD